MAIDDLDTLRHQIPELFDDRPLPSNWEEDWLIIPINDPELDSCSRSGVQDYEVEAGDDLFQHPQVGGIIGFPPNSELPDFAQRVPSPGALVPAQGNQAPPPDALAFYLPFHYFHPVWWGVYLVLERVHWLTRQLDAYSLGALDGQDAVTVARLFLYGHEAFHHSVETFATRLEVTHRVALYRYPFERYFRSHFGTSDCLEEALATAYGYRKVRDRAFRTPDDPEKRQAALGALLQYIKACPPGYAEAVDLLENGPFIHQRAWFAEDNHRFALPSIPGCDPVIWHSSPHAFSGISRVTSRVNYLVRRGSPLATRYRLGLRYIRYRDLAQRLQGLGCRSVRQKGSHVIWRPPSGVGTFPVPRHPGDLRKGTLAQIIKQAGLQMSVSEFIAAAGAD